MAYIEKEDVEKHTGLVISAGLDSFIAMLIDFAQEYIERSTGREFEQGEEDETRYYDGNDAIRLPIDDLEEITSLSVDGVALTENRDYFLYPLNDTVKEYVELSQPETEFVSNSRRASSINPYVFRKAQRNIEIVATFGFSETPALVKIVALKLVAAVIKENIGDTDVKELTAETLGDYSVTFAKVSEIADRIKIGEMLAQYERADLTPARGSILL